jgi:hypothetical protein
MHPADGGALKLFLELSSTQFKIAIEARDVEPKEKRQTTTLRGNDESFQFGGNLS